MLLDVWMPVMDGFEVLRELRQTPDRESTPVILLTAVSAKDGERKAMDLGVTHYITKPFDPDMVQSAVKVTAPQRASWRHDYEDDLWLGR